MSEVDLSKLQALLQISKQMELDELMSKFFKSAFHCPMLRVSIEESCDFAKDNEQNWCKSDNKGAVRIGYQKHYHILEIVSAKQENGRVIYNANLNLNNDEYITFSTVSVTVKRTITMVEEFKDFIKYINDCCAFFNECQVDGFLKFINDFAKENL